MFELEVDMGSQCDSYPHTDVMQYICMYMHMYVRTYVAFNLHMYVCT